MAQLSNQEFRTVTDSLFPTNSDGQITAERIRTHFDNTADSLPFKVTGQDRAPDNNDDGDNSSGAGAFAIGDIWVDETNDAAYVCVDNANVSAVWSGIATIPINARTVNYLYLNVNSGGTATPADPEGGDAFDTISNCFAWVENNFSGVSQLDLQLAEETYDAGISYDGLPSLTVPVNVGTLSVYGADRNNTILNNGRILGTRYQGVYLSSMTVNADGFSGCGGHYFYDVVFNSEGAMFFGGPGDQYYGSMGSRIADSVINMDTPLTFRRDMLNYLGSGVQIDGTVEINVTNSSNGNGSNGGYVFTVIGGAAHVLSGATLTVRDELASSPVTGDLFISQGASFTMDAGATIAVGNLIRDDSASANLSDLQPSIESVTANTYTTVAADNGKYKELTDGTAVAVSVDGSAGHAAGDEIEFEQTGTGPLTFTGTNGMTITSLGGLTATSGQYAYATLKFKSATSATLRGDLS